VALTSGTVLPNLYGLRFLAAMVVLLGHGWQNLHQINVLVPDWPLFQKGSIAVLFFFTLSGFLLAYLAQINPDGFNIKSFITRRLVRIVPLYYLVVIAGFLVLLLIFPAFTGEKYLHFSLLDGLPYYLFFVPNLAILSLPEPFGGLYNLWSIGSEMQFYLMFPVIIMLFSRAKMRLGFFLSLTLLWCCLHEFALNYPDPLWARFLDTIPFEYMFCGAFWGILLATGDKLFNRPSRWLYPGMIVTSILSFLLITTTTLDTLSGLHWWLPWIWGLLLYFYAQRPIRFLQARPIVVGGIVSYGIYLLHPWISFPLRWLFLKISFVASYSWTIYLLLLGILSWVFAWFIYRYYEQPLKTRFVSNQNRL